MNRRIPLAPSEGWLTLGLVMVMGLALAWAFFLLQVLIYPAGAELGRCQRAVRVQEQRDELLRVGGGTYLHTLVSSVPTAARRCGARVSPSSRG